MPVKKVFTPMLFTAMRTRQGDKWFYVATVKRDQLLDMFQTATEKMVGSHTEFIHGYVSPGNANGPEWFPITVNFNDIPVAAQVGGYSLPDNDYGEIYTLGLFGLKGDEQIRFLLPSKLGKVEEMDEKDEFTIFFEKDLKNEEGDEQ